MKVEEVPVLSINQSKIAMKAWSFNGPNNILDQTFQFSSKPWLLVVFLRATNFSLGPRL